MKQLVYFEFILYSCAIVLHSIAIVLIRSTQKSDSIFTNIQRMYLVNLSIVEILLSLTFVGNKILYTYYPNYETVKSLRFILHVTHACFLSLWYMSIMILITIDRFLTVYLNLRYRMYWPTRNSRIALIAAIAFSASLTFVNVFCSDTSEWDLNKIYTIYNTPPVHDVLFGVLIVLTYGYLYSRIRHYRRFDVSPQAITNTVTLPTTADTLPSLNVHYDKRQTDMKKLKKKFYLPTLLIVSFILFWDVPNGVHFHYYKDQMEIPKTLHLVIDSLYPLAIASDACIYIFATPSIRVKIIRKMRIWLS